MLFWGEWSQISCGFLQLLLGLFLSEQPVVRWCCLLPPAITPCLSLPLDLWLGSWVVYLPDSVGRHQCVHAVAGVNAFYRASRNPQFWKTSSGSKYLEANEAGLPAFTPTMSLTLCSLLG